MIRLIPIRGFLGARHVVWLQRDARVRSKRPHDASVSRQPTGIGLRLGAPQAGAAGHMAECHNILVALLFYQVQAWYLIDTLPLQILRYSL